uniref:Transposase (Putative), gypsy type n=1 Tax=Tanacetum cinerariifolium TaxID=118510 RepID=A0A699HPG4_TANCI|nr:hypothetical protein [Tanacetum cinerariifolium]
MDLSFKGGSNRHLSNTRGEGIQLAYSGAQRGVGIGTLAWKLRCQNTSHLGLTHDKCHWYYKIYDGELSGLRSLVGLDLQALLGLDLVLNKAIEMISCTIESKQLALPRGQTSRLDSGVRRIPFIGESSTSISLITVVAKVGPLLGQGSRSSCLRTRITFRGCQLIRTLPAKRLVTNPRPSCCPKPVVPAICHQVPQSSIFTMCGVMLRTKFHIPNTVHPEFPDHNNRIRNSPPGKISLSVISAAKVSHFEILCRVHGFVPNVGNFCRFYNNSKIKKFLEPFLCFVDISRYYEFDDNVYPVFLFDMDLFAFVNHADPTKVRIYKKQVEEGQTPLLESTRGRVVSLAGVNDQGNQNEVDQDVGAHVINEASGDAAVADQIEESDHVVQDEEANIVRIEDEVPATVAEKAKGSQKKRKVSVRGDGRTNSVMGPNLWTHNPTEWSSMPPPPILTVVVATTAIIGATFALIYESGTGPVQCSIFRDSASHSTADADIAGPSRPAGTEGSTSGGFSAKVRLRSEHCYRERKKFERKCQRQGTEAAWVDELNGLKEQNLALEEEKNAFEHKVAALEFVDAAKVAELASLTAQTAKLTQDLSELGLSCDELSVKASSLEAERDRLVGRVSLLEGTCYELRDEMSGYKLFKEQIEVVQDEQVKVLSDKVAKLDSDLMGMALHLDEEFYPCFLTTIAGRRKAKKGLIDVAARNPSIEANYISIVAALCAVDFPLLAQLESQKDADIADIMGLLHLDGLAVETLEADQLQPSPEQLRLPIH